MVITEVTADMLPLFLIELQNGEGHWNVFTREPFKTQAEAEEHRRLILQEYPSVPPERVRLAPFTEANWREQMIDWITREPARTRAALSTMTSADLRKFIEQEIATNSVVVEKD